MYADIAAQSRSLLVSAAHCQCRDLRPLLLCIANKEYPVEEEEEEEELLFVNGIQ